MTNHISVPKPWGGGLTVLISGKVLRAVMQNFQKWAEVRFHYECRHLEYSQMFQIGFTLHKTAMNLQSIDALHDDL